MDNHSSYNCRQCVGACVKISRTGAPNCVVDMDPNWALSYYNCILVLIYVVYMLYTCRRQFAHILLHRQLIQSTDQYKLLTIV